jgi:RNA polymerase sigma-54 factor
MAFEIKQSLRLSQQLVMTPQLQQAIKLLQLTRMELQEVVTQEMMENPILEEMTENPTEADTSNPEAEQLRDEESFTKPKTQEEQFSTGKDDFNSSRQSNSSNSHEWSYRRW